MYAPVLEISPAPSRDLIEQKSKKRKSDNLALEQEKDVSKSNKSHALKKPKVDKSITSHSDHIVFAIPAPAFVDSLRGSNVLLKSAKSPNSTSKPIRQERKRNLSSGTGAPIDLVGLKRVETKGGVGEDRKHDSEEGLKKLVKPGEKSNAPSPTSPGLKQALKIDGGSSERSRKVGKKPSEGGAKRSFKPPENRPIASSGNVSKLPKRASQDIGLNTSHRTSVSTPLLKNTKNPHVEVHTRTENITKADRNRLGGSPQATQEVVKTDVISRVLKGDEDAPNAPTTSQRQSTSPSLNVPTRKGDGFPGKESSPNKSPRPTLNTKVSDRDLNDIMEIPLTASPQQVTSHYLFLTFNHSLLMVWWKFGVFLSDLVEVFFSVRMWEVCCACINCLRDRYMWCVILLWCFYIK